MQPVNLSLVEPKPIQDTFIENIGRIEHMDGVTRFVLFSNQTCYEAGSVPMRVVAAKLVIPTQNIIPAVVMTLSHLGDHMLERASNILHLHR